MRCLPGRAGGGRPLRCTELGRTRQVRLVMRPQGYDVHVGPGLGGLRLRVSGSESGAVRGVRCGAHAGTPLAGRVPLAGVCLVRIEMATGVQPAHLHSAVRRAAGTGGYRARYMPGSLSPSLGLVLAMLRSIDSVGTYLALVAVGLCLQGASENERTRISEPHGNTHLRPSHNDPH